MPEIKVAAEVHSQRHAAGGPDPITPASIEAAPAQHTHASSEISDSGAAGRRILQASQPHDVTAEVMRSPRVLSNTDLDTVTTGGYYYTYTANTNLPPTSVSAGWLEVIQYSTDAFVLQRWTTFRPYASNSAQEVWFRTKSNDAWGEWTQVGPAVASGRPSSAHGNPGTFYVDRVSTNGASQWQKTATGWEVTVGDTGWRDVSSLADPASFDFTTEVPGGSYMRWRRIGSTVHLAVRSPLAEGTVGTPAATRRQGLINGSLPALGSPANPYIATGYGDIASSIMCSLTNSSTSTRLDVQPIAATGNVSSTITSRVLGGNVSWLTNDPWPTALPGTPA